MRKIVILDPDSSDPTWGNLDDAKIVEVPDWFDGFDSEYTPEQEAELSKIFSNRK